MSDAKSTVDFDVVRFLAHTGGNTGAGLAFVDVQGRYLFVSDGVAEVNGRPAADHVGRTMAEVIPHVWRRLEGAFTRALAGEPNKVELTGPYPADPNRIATWDVHWAPVYEDERLLGVAITMADVTGLRAAQERSEELIRRQATLRRISNKALSDVPLPEIFEDALASMAEHFGAPFTRLLEIEPGSDRLDVPLGTGWDPELVATTPVGRRAGSFVEFVMQNERPVTFTDLPNERRFRQPELFTRHNIHSGIGGRIIAGNRLWGMVACYDRRRQEFDESQVEFVQDMATVLGLLLREREARALQGDMLSLATHEIRTPLTNVIGLAQHIQRRAGRGQFDSVVELVDPLVTEAFRIDSMLSQWTELAVADSTPLAESDRSAVDLPALVADELARFRDRHPAIGVAVVSPERLVVRTHAGRVAEILENVLENGAKYAGSDLVLTVERDGDSVVIHCRDDGPGIAPEALPHIFERFYRGPGSSGRTGMGLGLYISRRLAETLGGTIEVESTLGEGATFTLCLPA